MEVTRSSRASDADADATDGVPTAEAGAAPAVRPRGSWLNLDPDADSGGGASERERLRTQSILDGITDSFAVYDEHWRVVYANPACGVPLGLTPKDMVGKGIWNLLPDLVGSHMYHELHRAMADKRPVTVEDHYARLDVYFEVHAYPIAGLGLAVYTRDITAKKHEQQLKARLAQYAQLSADVGKALSREDDINDMLQACCQALVKNLDVSFARIWLTDETGSVLELKASAGKYTHLDGAHARIEFGEYKIGRIAAEQRPHLTNYVMNDPQVADKAWARREGMVAFAGYPLTVAGRVAGVMAVFATKPLADDTLNALSSTGDAIAQGVERRRTQVDLQMRARELARSNAELEQFAYVASHDLQEPLRVVASYNRLLERRYKGKLDQDADDFINFSIEAAERMRQLIEDLLSYSRVGTKAKAKEPVDLDRVVAIARRNLDRAITEAGATVTAEPLPTVVGDANQLVALFQNLISNGIKFRHGERVPNVRIRAERDAKCWRIFVADNGLGIDAAYFDRIFVIFQRLHPRETHPGTGIGLAICKKIVERHDGRIWVESQPGSGATFCFTLPATPAFKGPPHEP